MDILFDNIFSKCQDLSSFEGRNLKDGQGQSLYPLVHLTEQDEDLVKGYAIQGLIMVERELNYIIQSTDYTTDTFNIEFIDDDYINKNVSKQMVETISSYVLSQWLADKSKERAESYTLILANMISALKRITMKKRPTLDPDY